MFILRTYRCKTRYKVFFDEASLQKYLDSSFFLPDIDLYLILILFLVQWGGGIYFPFRQEQNVTED